MIVFTCPECKESFQAEIYNMGELVSCPCCGTEFIAVKGSDGTLTLQIYEYEGEDYGE